MKARDCAAIVLASGLSNRFSPQDKLMANLHGKPVLAHIAQTVSEINFANRYAVIGAEAGSKEMLLKRFGFTCILNPAPAAGQGSALAIGAQAAIKDGHTSLCILLADMPIVSAAHIEQLLGTDGEIVMSTYKGIQMPPAVFRAQACKSLIKATGDRGAKSQLKPDNVKEVLLSELAARDIDTLEDLAELNALFSHP